MSSYIIPIFIILVLIYSLFKKINAYDSFVAGGKQAIDLCINTFPYLVAIFAVVELLSISGLSAILAKTAEPIFNIFKIPTELTEFLILRPFTGSGSMAMLSRIFSTYGPDSYISRCAAVIAGSSETVFYVSTIYFSGTKVKKLLYAIPCALIASFAAAILSCLLCRVM